MTRNMWIATIAWLLLTTGYLLRRRRSLHVTLMLTGIMMDISLVLFLEVSRGAIETAFSFSLSILKQLHIAASTSAFLLYFPVLYLGMQLVRGKGTVQTRERHVRIATAALLFRTLGFLLMFSMWKSPVQPASGERGVVGTEVVGRE